MVKGAGIHCHKPRSTISTTSPSIVATIEFYRRANGLLYAVTALVPARAEVKINKQSVSIEGNVGLSDIAT